jgi:hypothetical protein
MFATLSWRRALRIVSLYSMPQFRILTGKCILQMHCPSITQLLWRHYRRARVQESTWDR